MPPPIRLLGRLAAAVSVVALGACATLGPDFRRPDAPTGAAGAGYAMPGDAAAGGVRLAPEARAAGPWWLALGSPELDQAVRQALADSPTLAEAVAALQRARADADAVRGQQAPQLDASASASRDRINTQRLGFGGFPSPTVNLYSVGGRVSYDLDLFGGRRRATEQAEALAEAESRRAEAAYLALSGNVALQAVRIASLKAQIAAVQSVIGEDRRVLEMVRRAEEAGGEAASAITSGEAQLAEDEALLPPLQRELYAARHQLALLVGRAPGEWAPPEFDLARFTVPADIPVSLPSELVRRRPDILAAEAELHAATAAVGVAAASQYPNLSLSANLIQTAVRPEDLFGYDASGWSLGGGLAAPIFHGGSLKARRQAAEAEARAATARYQQTVLAAFVQVSDVLAALGADQQSISALARAAAHAETAARDAQTAYRLGGGTLLQVIDAQRQLSRARRALAQAEGQRFADLVQLFTATAGDWRSATS